MIKFRIKFVSIKRVWRDIAFFSLIAILIFGDLAVFWKVVAAICAFALAISVSVTRGDDQ